MNSGVKAFFIIGKGPHPEFAAAILRNLDEIHRLIREHADPFVAKVYQNRNAVEEWVTYAQWREGRSRSPRSSGRSDQSP